MGLLVLGPVAGVAEGLVARAVLADEGSLARVAPVVDLEVLQASEAARAAFNLQSFNFNLFLFKQTCAWRTKPWLFVVFWSTRVRSILNGAAASFVGCVSAHKIFQTPLSYT